MIYPCPHCQTDLEIHSVHFGKELSCPECNKAFTVEEIPPVVKYEPKEISFLQVFKIAIYAMISVLIVAAVCWGAYLAAKRFAPSLFKETKPVPKTETVDQAISRLGKRDPEKTVIYVQKTADQEESTAVQDQKNSVTPLKNRKNQPPVREIRQKNADAEQQFLNELNNAPENRKK